MMGRARRDPVDIAGDTMNPHRSAHPIAYGLGLVIGSILGLAVAVAGRPAVWVADRVLGAGWR